MQIFSLSTIAVQVLENLQKQGLLHAGSTDKQLEVSLLEAASCPNPKEEPKQRK